MRRIDRSIRRRIRAVGTVHARAADILRRRADAETAVGRETLAGEARRADAGGSHPGQAARVVKVRVTRLAHARERGAISRVGRLDFAARCGKADTADAVRTSRGARVRAIAVDGTGDRGRRRLEDGRTARAGVSRRPVGDTAVATAGIRGAGEGCATGWNALDEVADRAQAPLRLERLQTCAFLLRVISYQPCGNGVEDRSVGERLGKRRCEAKIPRAARRESPAAGRGLGIDAFAHQVRREGKASGEMVAPGHGQRVGNLVERNAAVEGDVGGRHSRLASVGRRWAARSALRWRGRHAGVATITGIAGVAGIARSRARTTPTRRERRSHAQRTGAYGRDVSGPPTDNHRPANVHHIADGRGAVNSEVLQVTVQMTPGNGPMLR